MSGATGLYLQPEQIRRLGLGPQEIVAAVNSLGGALIPIKQAGESFDLDLNHVTGDYTIVERENTG